MKKLRNNIVVLSPHLDDAAFSCCDHILKWKNEGFNVTIVTIFSSFGTSKDNQCIIKTIQKHGFASLRLYEKQRQNEDTRAMKAIGVSWKQAGFIDGAFRTINGKTLYSKKNLYRGYITNEDRAIIKSVQELLRTFQSIDKIVCPFGIGNHIDHMITRTEAEKTFENTKILYYADIPYIFEWRNWNYQNICSILFSKKSILWKTQGKERIIKFYTSQLGFYSCLNIRYPEILITKPKFT